MLRQRVYSLALGYEDLNDQEQMKKDPMLRLLAGKKDQQEDLAGKSTLNRLELSTGMTSRYKKVHYWREALDELLLDLFVESFAAVPEEIVLDLDATDLPLDGGQEGRFYHGYYGHYCYLPLYIAAGQPGCQRGVVEGVGTGGGALASAVARGEDHRAGRQRVL